jgi:hypothetical protein
MPAESFTDGFDSKCLKASIVFAKELIMPSRGKQVEPFAVA